MKKLTKNLILLIILSGMSLTAAERASFQLDSSLHEHAQIFFVSDSERIVRFSTLVSAEHLTAKANPIASYEISINSEAKFQKFAIYRFSGVEVYDVRKEEERLKFVKLEGASALMAGPISDYRSSYIKTSDVLAFIQDSAQYSTDNLKILKALRLIPADDHVAAKAENSSRDEFLKLLDEDVKGASSAPAAIDTATAAGDENEAN